MTKKIRFASRLYRCKKPMYVVRLPKMLPDMWLKLPHIETWLPTAGVAMHY